MHRGKLQPFLIYGNEDPSNEDKVHLTSFRVPENLIIPVEIVKIVDLVV